MAEDIKLSTEEAALIFRDLYSVLMRDTQHEALGNFKERGIVENATKRRLFIRLAEALGLKSKISEHEALSMGIIEWVSEETIEKCSVPNRDNRYHFPIIKYFRERNLIQP